jgi:DNA-binding response OmpR family regulator
MTTKVLLVDDDTMVLDYLRQLLTTAGYEVVTAACATTALASMQTDFAQIVILDVNMSGMDGLALCRAIRRQSYAGYVYVILHSAKDTEADILEGLDAGADDYMAKGSSSSRMLARLRSALRILALQQSPKTRVGSDEQASVIDIQTAAYT